MVDDIVRQNQALQATVAAAGDVIIPVKAAVGVSISVENLINVSIVAKEDYATLVWNSATGKYEVKKLDMDGGTF